MAYRMGTEKCDNCYGHGSHSSSESCSSCSGSGVSTGFFGGESICSSCDGEGTKDYSRTCSSCNGSGVQSCKEWYCDDCGNTDCTCQDDRW